MYMYTQQPKTTGFQHFKLRQYFYSNFTENRKQGKRIQNKKDINERDGSCVPISSGGGDKLRSFKVTSCSTGEWLAAFSGNGAVLLLGDWSPPLNSFGLVQMRSLFTATKTALSGAQ